ncbi:hypothetical protein DFS34DRAFT_687727 [Phlyctochytrium arcticum]|nr:hypothetical protein DFS34DRAFT_687727 [Phlyctochytrium arcticum]
MSDFCPKLSSDTALEKFEYINDIHIKYCLQSPFVLHKLKTRLRALKHRKVGKNLYRTEYAYSEKGSLEQIGRLWARGLSLQNLEARDNHFRQYLAAGRYHDIDQVNSIFTLIAHLFKQHSITCDALTHYVENRSTILTEKNIDKQEVVSMMLFAGRKISDPFFSEIHSVIYTTLCPILKIEYPDIWEKVRTSRDATIKGNREGSFIAQVTQTLENRVTLLTDQFFTDRGWSVDALIFDGGMIRKRDGHDMTQELLDECSQFVFDECGIHIKLAEKPLVVSDAFLEKFRLKYEPLEEEDDEEDDDDEPPKKKQKDDLDFEALRDLPSGKWKYFDFKRLYAPTHLNAAKWFIEEQSADSIMKHTSGFLYILGKDNIWREYDTIGASDLNIQVAETLVSSFKSLIQEAEDDMQNVNDLRDVFKQFQRIIEMNDFSGNVAKNVDRLSVKNDNYILWDLVMHYHREIPTMGQLCPNYAPTMPQLCPNYAATMKPAM